MTSIFCRKSNKALCLLLVVCLLVFCCAPTASAVLTEAAIITYSASAVVGALLVAMGISHGVANTDFDSTVTAVVGYLGSLGYVDSSGDMTLTSLGAGVVSIGGLVISAVRDFLFGTSSATAVLTHGVSLSGKFAVAYNAYPEKVAAFNTANDVGYVITQKIPRGNGNYMWEVIILSTGFTTTDNVNFSFSGSYTVPPYLDFTYRDEFGNTSYGNWTRLVFSAYSGYEPVVYTSLPVTTSTSLDLNIGNIGTLNPDDNIDVIYPGWYQNAESVDTNIGVDTDGDSVVDTNIPVDSYYPLGVPLNPSDIYNQTQAGAQTGTSTGALEGTKDDIYDSTKDGADGYNIGGAGEYTFQVKDFFPFCIPFDLYDMLTCLAAEPEAPSFTWTIPVLGNNYDINVDLSAFDSVAVLVRSLEMLAFAVGLAFASKRLIQGGD